MPRVTRKTPRRPRRRFDWAPVRRGAFALGGAAALGVVGYGAYSIWQYGPIRHGLAAVATLEDDMIATAVGFGFSVQEISVAGRKETSAATVLAAIKAPRGSPMLAFDPAVAKQALEALPWVKRASVERRLPNAIHADLTERKPLALWQRDARLYVIDHDGEEIRGVDPERFAELLVLVGDDAPANANALMAILASEPSFHPRLDAAIRVSGRRWNLRLENGVEIQLPEVNPSAAWARLAALDTKGKLLDGSARVIDLRLPDRMIVRVARDSTPTPTPEPMRPGRARPRQI